MAAAPVAVAAAIAATGAAAVALVAASADRGSGAAVWTMPRRPCPRRRAIGGAGSSPLDQPPRHLSADLATSMSQAKPYIHTHPYIHT